MLSACFSLNHETNILEPCSSSATIIVAAFRRHRLRVETGAAATGQELIMSMCQMMEAERRIHCRALAGEILSKVERLFRQRYPEAGKLLQSVRHLIGGAG
jgi:hypothetical protein